MAKLEYCPRVVIENNLHISLCILCANSEFEKTNFNTFVKSISHDDAHRFIGRLIIRLYHIMVHIPTEYVDMILWILEFRILKNIKALTKYQVDKYGTDVWLRMHLIQTRVKRSVHLICKGIYFRRVYFSGTSSKLLWDI